MCSEQTAGLPLRGSAEHKLGRRYGDQETTERPPAPRDAVAPGKLRPHRALARVADGLVPAWMRCDAGVAGSSGRSSSRHACVARDSAPPGGCCCNRARRSSGGMEVPASGSHLSRLVAPGLLLGARTLRVGEASTARRLRAGMDRSRPFRYSACSRRVLLVCRARGCRWRCLRSNGQGGDWSARLAVRIPGVALVRPLVSLRKLEPLFCGPTRRRSRRAPPSRRSRLNVKDVGQTCPSLLDPSRDLRFETHTFDNIFRGVDPIACRRSGGRDRWPGELATGSFAWCR